MHTLYPGVDGEFGSPSVLSLETADNWASFYSKATETRGDLVGLTIREWFLQNGKFLGRFLHSLVLGWRPSLM